MTLGERIQTLRHAAGLTQEQLSSALEVSRQAVSKWESGEAVPELPKLVALSALFGVSLDELVRGEAGRQEKCESTGVSLEELARRSELGRQKRMGGYIAVLGALLAALSLFFLPVYGTMQKAQVDGQGFYSDFMRYADKPPMSILFLLSGALVLAGAALTLQAVLRGRKTK